MTPDDPIPADVLAKFERDVINDPCWCIGYELTSANSEILDAALDMARAALASTAPQRPKEG